jgi:hypothetical protein
MRFTSVLNRHTSSLLFGKCTEVMSPRQGRKKHSVDSGHPTGHLEQNHSLALLLVILLQITSGRERREKRGEGNSHKKARKVTKREREEGEYLDRITGLLRIFPDG